MCRDASPCCTRAWAQCLPQRPGRLHLSEPFRGRTNSTVVLRAHCAHYLMAEMPGGRPAERKVGFKGVQGCLHLVLRARSGLPSPGPACPPQARPPDNRWSFSEWLDVGLVRGMPGSWTRTKACHAGMLQSCAAALGPRAHQGPMFCASTGTMLGMMLFNRPV